ncbi:phosphodiester glycosidase family protein [Paenibacillus sp. y28]|uniref:phosphodiester glycosidase family protein n=1 Tax=Paenibacillus sp. y28 TaxID=3129110 RepID=UPI0030165943
MNAAVQWWGTAWRQFRGWSIPKKGLMVFWVLIFMTSSFLYLTPPGQIIREFMADTVITTQHRDWAWIVVGKEKRDWMVSQIHSSADDTTKEKQNFGLIHHNRTPRALDELVSVKDISGTFWKGKLMYVYDPLSVRVVVPNKQGEGERISSMAERTGAVAGINGGGFIDPDGLGNGFAPIGIIMSNFKPLYTDADADTAQNIVGFTNEGTLVVGKYSLNEMRGLHVKEAVSFLAPRLIANGKPQITTGDGGWGRAPRTAVGQKADGTVLFVVIDGRQTSSVGATLKEVQDVLMEEGAVNAGLLDGGASSELVWNNQLITKPSSRYGERRLPSGFLVYDDPDSVVVESVWEGLTKIDAGGAYDHPDFLREQAQLKAQQANKPKATPAPAASSSPKTDDAKATSPSKTTTPATGASTGSGNGTGTSTEAPAKAPEPAASAGNSEKETQTGASKPGGTAGEAQNGGSSPATTDSAVKPTPEAGSSTGTSKPAPTVTPSPAPTPAPTPTATTGASASKTQ